MKFQETCEAVAPPKSGWQPEVAVESALVLSNQAVNAEYKHLIVKCSALAAGARPGQFFHLLCPGDGRVNPYFRRPMSVYGIQSKDLKIEFMYKVTGAGTRALATLGVGDHLNIMGPLGQGFTLSPSWRHIILVARGVGLATLAPLVAEARAADIQVTTILSARSPDLLLSQELFQALGAKVITVTDAQANSSPAHVEALLRALITTSSCDALFTCGSARLAKMLQKFSKEFGIPGQIAMEQQMACGIGACYCCVRDFNVEGKIVSQRVCYDGPVFDLNEAVL